MPDQYAAVGQRILWAAVGRVVDRRVEQRGSEDIHGGRDNRAEEDRLREVVARTVPSLLHARPTRHTTSNRFWLTACLCQKQFALAAFAVFALPFARTCFFDVPFFARTVFGSSGGWRGTVFGSSGGWRGRAMAPWKRTCAHSGPGGTAVAAGAVLQVSPEHHG